MARIELADAAVEDRHWLIGTYSPPEDTRARLRRGLGQLEQVPRLGPGLHGRWAGLRVVLGPWRWMLVIYPASIGLSLFVALAVADRRGGVLPQP